MLSMLMSVAALSVVSKILTVEDFGKYQLALTLYGVLALMAVPRMSAATTQSVARGFKGSYQRNKRPIQLGALAAVVSLAVVSSSAFLIDLPPSVKSACTLLAIFFVPYYALRLEVLP